MPPNELLGSVTFSTTGAGVLAVCTLVGFGVGMLANDFVIGGIVGLTLLVVARFRLPLRASDADTVSSKSLLQKASKHTESHDGA